MTSTAPFVIIVLCAQATLDHLIYEQKRHKAIVVDVFQFKKNMDYLAYKDKVATVQEREILLMFIFGKNDSMLIQNADGAARLQERLERDECESR